METYSEYLTRPHQQACIVCGQSGITWTDFNQEAVCLTCGVSYYIAQYRVATLAIPYRVQPEDCKPFSATPITWHMRDAFRDYFDTTGNRLPLGMYMRPNHNAYTREDAMSFYTWIYEHREQYPECKDWFYMDKIEAELREKSA